MMIPHFTEPFLKAISYGVDFYYMKEMRQFERFILYSPATLYLREGLYTPSREIHSIAHDISSGGAFLEVRESAIDKEAEMIVEVILTIEALQKLYGYSNEVKLTSKANLIRTTIDGIGVSFNGKPVMVSNIN